MYWHTCVDVFLHMNTVTYEHIPKYEHIGACICIHALMCSYICVHVFTADGEMIVRW